MLQSDLAEAVEAVEELGGRDHPISIGVDRRKDVLHKLVNGVVAGQVGRPGAGGGEREGESGRGRGRGDEGLRE